MPPHVTAPDTPPDRGEDTRRRLVEAALPEFARDGYDGVSIRRIAEAAEANVAAVAYHFGGKRGLYLAVARHVAERNGAAVAPLVERVAAEVAAADGDRVRLGALLARVVTGFLRGMVTAREDGRAGFLVRELLTPSDAFDILYDGFFEPMNRAMSLIAAAAHGVAPDSAAAVLRGHLVFGAVMPFIAGRAVVERRLGREILEGAALEETLAVAVAAACGSLGLPAPASPAPASPASPGEPPHA